MNEIKKCPFCGGSPAIETIRNNSRIEVSVVCQSCHASVGGRIYVDDKKQYSENFIKHCAYELWNERKETRFERLLKEERQADKLVCCLAYRDKYKSKECSSLTCSECEFHDPKTTINYLLAPYED